MAQGGFVQQQQPEPVAAAPVPAPAAFGVADPNLDPNNTNNLLQLARRLHEEHVKEGIDKRDALIAEGHATAARLVAEAETRQRAQLGNLDQERQVLEHRIEELRNFEREYRQKLKGYIEGQLRELDSSNMITAGGGQQAPQSQQPHAQQPQPQSQQPQIQAAAPVGYAAPPVQSPVGYPGFAGN